MARRIARAISRWLCPDVHRKAERYWRLRNDLEDARWWMGASHPDAAALAQWAIDKDHWYWTSEHPMRRPEWKWQAPWGTTDIGALRNWLDTKPFAQSEEPSDVR
jgi:hypothetical protein